MQSHTLTRHLLSREKIRRHRTGIKWYVTSHVNASHIRINVTYEWITHMDESHIWMSPVTYERVMWIMRQTCHIWIFQKQRCRTGIKWWVMSHVNASHIRMNHTYMNELHIWMSTATYERVMWTMRESCRVWICLKQRCRTGIEWRVMSHMNASHIWINHTYEWVLPHMSVSCELWSRHVSFEYFKKKQRCRTRIKWWVMSRVN